MRVRVYVLVCVYVCVCVCVLCVVCVLQYSLDYYPPFASGCGFVLSWDLVDTLATAAPNLPDYRLLVRHMGATH